MKFPAESITALQQFGYTQREAEFLYIVAAHSGFFCQRQFMHFVDVAGRGPATYFIKKAIHKQHIREHVPEHGTQKIYHLFSRTVYKAIGKGTSRHRRTGRYGLLEKAPVRLLGLDFVLAKLDQHYLEEEANKVDYLVGNRQISQDLLPAKVFRGEKGSETRRYFFENFPIFISEDKNSTLVNFTYLEDDIRSLQTFTSFVQRYRPLFARLGERFRLIFVSNSTQTFQFARDAFVRTMMGEKEGRAKQQLARFFWLRKMAEEKRFKELAHKDVVEWQRGLKRYSDPECENQYQIWRLTGTQPKSTSELLVPDPRKQFETFLAVPNVMRLGSSASFTTAQVAAQAPTESKPA
jgi:hypothetical protein